MRLESDSPDPIAHLRLRGRSRVCAIAREEDSPAAVELFNRAAGSQKAWTLPGWTARLKALDKCQQKVSDWLEKPMDWFD